MAWRHRAHTKGKSDRTLLRDASRSANTQPGAPPDSCQAHKGDLSFGAFARTPAPVDTPRAPVGTRTLAALQPIYPNPIRRHRRRALPSNRADQARTAEMLP